jgi:putative heme-binding domain-containing protein
MLVSIVGPLGIGLAPSLVGARAAAQEYTPQPGFAVERACDLEQSFIALTFGAETPGSSERRVFLSVENGPILWAIDHDGDGKFESHGTFTSDVTNAQGLVWYDGRLFAVGERKGEPGIYRITPSKNGSGVSAIDEIAPIRGTGEHGAHGIVVGPDGFLYVALGNQSALATPPHPLSPLLVGNEATLLPPLYDPNGFNIDCRYPDGVIARLDARSGNWTYHSVGYRNHYRIAFDTDGELFTCDSDMEWDLGLPWYRPVRVLHCLSGCDYGARSGSAMGRSYDPDTVPEVAVVGRGSPTGMAFYTGKMFPTRWRGALLVGDWARDRIFAVHMKPKGASFTGSIESLLELRNSSGITDLAVGSDGAVYFTTGGRGALGELHRLSYTAPPEAAADANAPSEPAESKGESKPASDASHDAKPAIEPPHEEKPASTPPHEEKPSSEPPHEDKPASGPPHDEKPSSEPPHDAKASSESTQAAKTSEPVKEVSPASEPPKATPPTDPTTTNAKPSSETPNATKPSNEVSPDAKSATSAAATSAPATTSASATSASATSASATSAQAASESANAPATTAPVANPTAASAPAAVVPAPKPKLPLDRRPTLDELKACLAGDDLRLTRRACEELVTLATLESDIRDRLYALLGSPDPFVRQSARASLERTAAKDLFARLEKEHDPERMLQTVLLLSHAKVVDVRADALASYLSKLMITRWGALNSARIARVLEIVLINSGELSPDLERKLASRLIARFPGGPHFSRELAILLAHWNPPGAIDRLVDACAAETDREQAIHYAYCSSAIEHGWTAAAARKWSAWFESTSSWTGGASFTGYLEAMHRRFLMHLPPEVRSEMLKQGGLSLETLASLLMSSVSTTTIETSHAIAAANDKAVAPADTAAASNEKIVAPNEKSVAPSANAASTEKGAAGDKTVKSSEKPTAPSDKASEPADKPVAPGEKPVASSEKDTAPSGKTPEGSERTPEPSDKTAEPTDKATPSTDKATAPNEKTAAPSETTAAPSDKNAPSDKALVPGDKSQTSNDECNSTNAASSTPGAKSESSVASDKHAVPAAGDKRDANARPSDYPPPSADTAELMAAVESAYAQLGDSPADLAQKRSALRTLGECRVRGVATWLRTIALGKAPEHSSAMIALARQHRALDQAVLLQALASTEPGVPEACADGLRAIGRKPSDPRAWAAVLDSAHALGAPRGWAVLQVAQSWLGKPPLATKPDEWAHTLQQFEAYFNVTFPSFQRAPRPEAERPNWDHDHVLAFLEKSRARSGSAALGAQVFRRASCANCHVFNPSESAETSARAAPAGTGSQWGPDLSTVSRRFNTQQLLESIDYPSRNISDQYRTSIVEIGDEQHVEGRIVEQDDQSLTLLSNDGARNKFAKSEIKNVAPSNVSPMPEGLLTALTLEDIKDLFAFLSSEGRVDESDRDVPWTPLFTGAQRTNWNYDANDWKLRSDVLIGRAENLARSSYVLTKTSYADFEMEFDVFMPNGNSGFQYRSSIDPSKPDPVGYQADIGQAYWGSLYASDGRDTLVAADPTVWQSAVNVLGWNHFFVGVHGDHHVIEINGVTTVDAHDAEHPSGVLGFQLHQGMKMEVRFANVRMRALEAR